MSTSKDPHHQPDIEDLAASPRSDEPDFASWGDRRPLWFRTHDGEETLGARFQREVLDGFLPGVARGDLRARKRAASPKTKRSGIWPGRARNKGRG
jgi:hypothetical protein